MTLNSIQRTKEEDSFSQRISPPYLSKTAVISTFFAAILLSISVLGILHKLTIPLPQGVEIGAASLTALGILASGIIAYKAHQKERDFYTYNPDAYWARKSKLFNEDSPQA